MVRQGRVPKSIIAIGRWSKIGRKLVGNGSKNGRKLVENWSKFVRKLVENWSKFVQNLSKDCPKTRRNCSKTQRIVEKSDLSREVVGSESEVGRKCRKQRMITACPTVQIELQVRGKDVSFPYHHALTVSSLGSDCQACTAPLLGLKLRGKTRKDGIESTICGKTGFTTFLQIGSGLQSFSKTLSSSVSNFTLFLGVYTHTPPEGG